MTTRFSVVVVTKFKFLKLAIRYDTIIVKPALLLRISQTNAISIVVYIRV